MNPNPLVDAKRLIAPPEDLSHFGEKLAFRGAFSLETNGESVLLTDPNELADVYNAVDDEDAIYLRKNGVFLMDFGGDTGGPVWWQSPYLVLPLSFHYTEEPVPPNTVTVMAEEVGTDSGSFVFVPVTDAMPPSLKSKIQEVVRKRHGVLLSLPGGRYSFFYEQFDSPHANTNGLYRNIVVRKD